MNLESEQNEQPNPVIETEEEDKYSGLKANHRPKLPVDLRARNLISLTQELIKLLKQENAALDRPSSSVLAPLVREKEALFKIYDEETDFLTTHPEFMKQITPELKEELRLLAHEFDELVRLNEKKLKVTLKVSRHLVGRIAEAARKAKGQINAYSKKGTMDIKGNTSPVKINQEL